MSLWWLAGMVDCRDDAAVNTLLHGRSDRSCRQTDADPRWLGTPPAPSVPGHTARHVDAG